MRDYALHKISFCKNLECWRAYVYEDKYIKFCPICGREVVQLDQYYYEKEGVE